jgi:hypothetical protein
MTCAQIAIMLTNSPSDISAATSSMAERIIGTPSYENIGGTLF